MIPWYSYSCCAKVDGAVPDVASGNVHCTAAKEKVLYMMETVMYSCLRGRYCT